MGQRFLYCLLILGKMNRWVNKRYSKIDNDKSRHKNNDVNIVTCKLDKDNFNVEVGVNYCIIFCFKYRNKED
jgi:hypothetical protein